MPAVPAQRHRRYQSLNMPADNLLAPHAHVLTINNAAPIASHYAVVAAWLNALARQYTQWLLGITEL